MPYGCRRKPTILQMACTASKGTREPVMKNGSQNMKGGKSCGVSQYLFPMQHASLQDIFLFFFLQFYFSNSYSEDGFFEELCNSLYDILESENGAI